MIVTDVTFSDFWSWLQSSNGYKNNFSYDGAKALFEWLDELSEDNKEPMDFDPVAWCVEFTEYENLKNFQHDTGYIKDGISYDGYPDIKTIEDLQDHTLVVCESPLIIQDF